jgi:hypothetical protein
MAKGEGERIHIELHNSVTKSGVVGVCEGSDKVGWGRVQRPCRDVIDIWDLERAEGGKAASGGAAINDVNEREETEIGWQEIGFREEGGNVRKIEILFNLSCVPEGGLRISTRRSLLHRAW